ncbi:hypothetical protein SOVF_004510 [Spinacia oleracea]|uniref:Sulfotransferase n=1 Tax=Spinacia oleracea TaxID=3562 RepID=A0A9R0K7G5_SPIOL|nr:cytosolic sulfotransferase 5-like [Spinacia oleracea]KNA25660.1 hypothetical protein SOVF_004510 [Spinacia oleracea]
MAATNTKTQPPSKDDEMWFGFPMHFYQGFWLENMISENVDTFQTHFQANDTDIILASLPKTGTTWLKSLLFTIFNRKFYSDVSKHPLLTTTPHELVLQLEFDVYKNSLGCNPPNHTEIPSPRLFATHIPYLPLPESIKTSKCKIVYVCRNPFDNFISFCNYWIQFNINEGIKLDIDLMEEYLDKYCKGIVPFGPYEDHLLGYWKESLKNPEKVLFLEYEGMKKEPKSHLKRLAEFVGCPFSEEEEEGNVIDEIIELCSLKNLKEVEVNKSGKFFGRVGNKALFGKGEVGGWNNYLTPSMAKQFDQMLQKLKEAGFSFTHYKT